MELEQNETFEIHGPQLEVFGKAESALPAPAKKKPTAAIFLVVLAIISTFGIGGLKLKGKYNDAKALYTVSDKYGNTTQTDFEYMADSAANMIRLCSSELGAENSEVQAAQAALDQWNASAAKTESPSIQYTEGQALYTALESLYSAARNQVSDKTWSEISGQHDNAASAWAAIMTDDTPTYNEEAKKYNQTVSGFPASVIGNIWDCKELEIFG